MKRLALLPALVLGVITAGVAPASASSISFHVQVNTAPLIGNSSAPFYLDFLLIDGSGTLAVPNTVTIGDFNFTSGAPSGSPTLSGGASGNLATSVTLTDNLNFSNEFFQAFTPGALLGFDVTMTTNADPTAPDAFSFAILDKNLFNLPTTSALLDDSLLFAQLTPGLSNRTVVTSSTTNPAGVTVNASAIPEPGTLLLLGTGLAVTIRRRFKK